MAFAYRYDHDMIGCYDSYHYLNLNKAIVGGAVELKWNTLGDVLSRDAPAHLIFTHFFCY